MRLNGWQRIWIVLSMLLLIPAVAFMVSIGNPIKERQQIMRDWAEKTSKLIYEEDPDVRDALEVTSEKPGQVTAQELMKMIHAPERVMELYPEMSHSEFIERAQADYSNKDAPIKIHFGAVNIEHRERLDRWRERFPEAYGKVLGIWLAICAGMYAAGWIIGWIIRGFRRT